MFPTPVGMNRTAPLLFASLLNVPHAYGDEPDGMTLKTSWMVPLAPTRLAWEPFNSMIPCATWNAALTALRSVPYRDNISVVLEHRG